MPASITHYIDVLGFRKNWDWGEPPTFASVSRGDITISLSQGGQGSSGCGTWLLIDVEDVDALHREYAE